MVDQFHDRYLSLHLVRQRWHEVNAWRTVHIPLESLPRPLLSILTFNKTDLLNFSLLIILTATVFLVTQWTPSLTSPVHDKQNTDSHKTHIRSLLSFYVLSHQSVPSRAFFVEGKDLRLSCWPLSLLHYCSQLIFLTPCQIDRPREQLDLSRTSPVSLHPKSICTGQWNHAPSTYMAIGCGTMIDMRAIIMRRNDWNAIQLLGASSDNRASEC